MQSYSMRVSWAQIVGTRAYQEDCVSITRWSNGFHLLVLADGVGGNSGGKEASNLVARSVRDYFLLLTEESREIESDTKTDSSLIQAIRASNDAIRATVEEQPDLEGMASTVIAATFDGFVFNWVSIGDSPLFLLRDGHLHRLNADHSMASVLDRRAAAGEITAEEAQSSLSRNELLAAIMGEELEMVDEPDQPIAARPGDIFLLSSDGLQVLGIDVIEDIISERSDDSPDAIVDALLAAVENLNRRSQDNTTIVVASIGENED